MKSITFEDMKPGMILYAAFNGNPHTENIENYYILYEKIEPGSKFWGNFGALRLYSPDNIGGDPYSPYSMRYHSEHNWFHIEDLDTVTTVKNSVKAEIEKIRNKINELESFIDSHIEG